jgi:uncharacterized protein
MNSGFPEGRVDLDRLRTGPVDWSGELPSERGAWEIEELELVESPRLEYRAEAGGHGGVRVSGRLEATLGLQCRRCLGQIRWPLEVRFDFRFDPSVREWEEEGGVFGLDPESPSLDLMRPLREELALAMPEYAVCADGCRGLCPACGADLNESECGCGGDEADPRWDLLRQLVSDEQPGAAGPDDEYDGNEG